MNQAWPNEFPGAYWMDEKEENAVLDVLRNGSLFRYYGVGDPDYVAVTGKPKYVDALEAAARAYYGCDYALALNSGTGALITCMRALGVGPGCEVILPAFLWVATVGAHGSALLLHNSLNMRLLRDTDREHPISSNPNIQCPRRSKKSE